MVLIEGLGDEVTLVLGSFVLIVVLLLGWLSTHTDDIPLIREVGVIVVELRQRTRNRPMITEQPQENEISQQSRAGISTVGSSGETSSREPSGEGSSNQREDGENAEMPNVENAACVNVDEKQSSENQDLVLQVSGNQHSNAANAADNARSSQNINVDSRLNDPSVFIPSSSSQLHHQPEGEVLRRRRVQYFESGATSSSINKAADSNGSNSASSSSSNDNVLDCDISSENAASPSVPFGGDGGGLSVGDNGDGVSQQILTDLSEKLQKGLKISSSSNNHKDAVDNVSAAATNASYQTHENAGHDPSKSNNVDNQDIHSEVRGSAGASANDGAERLVGSSIRVRLKYMNETQRFVDAKREDTIGDFRRTHFQTELQENKWVRFIFNGQDLRDDNSTLQAYNIENNCTMHCLVSDRQQAQTRQETAMEEDDESMLGSMMYPLFTVLLLIVWYFRIFYRQYFSAMSTVCLIGISFLLGLSYVSSLRTADNTSTSTSSTANGSQQQSRQQSTNTTSGSLLGQGNSAAVNHPHLD